MDERRQDERRDRVSKGEDERVVRVGEEPGKEDEADGDEQPAGAVLGATRPGGEAAGDERQPDDQHDRDVEGLLRVVVARRRQGGAEPGGYKGGRPPAQPEAAQRGGRHSTNAEIRAPDSSPFGMKPHAPLSPTSGP